MQSGNDRKIKSRLTQLSPNKKAPLEERGFDSLCVRSMNCQSIHLVVHPQVPVGTVETERAVTISDTVCSARIFIRSFVDQVLRTKNNRRAFVPGVANFAVKEVLAREVLPSSESHQSSK